ncbi:MAG: hypothetical protein LBE57_04045 [Methanosarcinales archaeon]|jgi:negative regulator of genetic competence, sporulation and motility|nr:hypothetical protein [Methanosarcinales archaeon]
MKKSFLILIILLTAALVGVSGCLGSDDAGSNTTNNTTNNTTEPPAGEADNSSNDSNQSNVTIIRTFSAAVVSVNPLPEGFTHIATRSAVSNTQGLGISEAYNGFRNMLTYDNANVFLSVYRCTAKTADEVIQDMIASHASRYGNDSRVSTVMINGHEATLLEATVLDTPQEGRYILVWSNWTGDPFDDSFLVVVNGQVNYSVIKALAEASNL